MNDQEFSDLLGKARSAGRRADFSPQEYGFETRMAATIAALSAEGLNTAHLIWRTAAGFAALVGMIGVWFVLIQASTETEDDLTAFWDAGEIALDADFLN
ncbi:MAG: hypothetical protein EOP86_01630 [Verrucomicrobiaceae bacterium]|nr:MAG: hypothetical protein EOP86_01630 [Verrucomicrobiaceae bacterium]